jgi:hypothetical protein
MRLCPWCKETNLIVENGLGYVNFCNNCTMKFQFHYGIVRNPYKIHGLYKMIESCKCGGLWAQQTMDYTYNCYTCRTSKNSTWILEVKS